jgi:hypothetical protein
MNIAIFADVHGRILLCFKLCARWEQETGQRIDLILQAGDLGVFPEPTGLDKATIRHAAEDLSELGFQQDFVRHDNTVAATLAQTRCNLVFVRGNHEDHQWLDALQQQVDTPIFAVDAYHRLYCMRTGVPYIFRSGDETITILGIGRIGPPVGETEPRKPKYLQPDEEERLYDLGDIAIDVLLTHDCARDYARLGYGMEEIRLLLDHYKPPYHFYGHIETPLDQHIDANGVTYSCKLSDLTWDDAIRGGPVNSGAKGVLHWRSGDEHAFEVVDQPWLNEYTRHTWRYL